jgi:nicotinamidase-related amidase|tara:strand:+ start:703 stop:1269 length:567 start_codon:yes stop_codon:yes gene_type:complete
MSLHKKSPILICIDLQQGFLDEEYWGGGRNNQDAELICASVIKKWRELGLEIIHVRHSSTNPLSKLHKDNEGFLFNPLTQPADNEITITKSVNSAFIGTNLKELIDEKSCNTIIIVGLTTDHCISTTTRMAGNYGYETYLISDATATFNKIGIDGEEFDSELIHSTALASLHEEFASVINSDTLFKIL